MPRVWGIRRCAHFEDFMETGRRSVSGAIGQIGVCFAADSMAACIALVFEEFFLEEVDHFVEGFFGFGAVGGEDHDGAAVAFEGQ